MDNVISLLSVTGLTTIFGPALLPRWMCILLSSVVVMMLALMLVWHFLMGTGTICFSGVTLNTARPMVISWGSGEAEVSDTTEVLIVVMEIGDKGLPEAAEGILLLSGDLALDIVVIVTGDLALSGPRIPVIDFTLWLDAEWVGMIVILDLG